MVYQEDVIKIALHFGGFASSHGDILRRAMSGKGDKHKMNCYAFFAQQEGHTKKLSQKFIAK
jgi:DNA polymerase III alpha subunit